MNCYQLLLPTYPPDFLLDSEPPGILPLCSLARVSLLSSSLLSRLSPHYLLPRVLSSVYRSCRACLLISIELVLELVFFLNDLDLYSIYQFAVGGEGVRYRLVF